MISNITPIQLIQLAGAAQIALAIGSLAVPRLLNWTAELSKVSSIIRQMFWVYAAYILVINLSFGTVSVFCAEELADHSTLATLVSAFIAVYWISRLLIQFFVLDRAGFPTGTWHKIGETVLVSVFVILSASYSYIFYLNLINHVN
ncbi:hypothetical protein [Mucilaginibacter myungsuensis]|uniref:Uncharacterized protein n=1 Tax=Mucilaginibacter myungsuensis TaxID=649104 RepID=A0A929KST3_9SPHI|nr:hypothetical protein [Mucilaginibacter myungsuensis]MBE9660879.1 hypothetical protein [Mucilaginibacter myungsuensis]MDN3600926.1 hypothetical protein [Mucilaginibacter myungsuensis]